MGIVWSHLSMKKPMTPPRAIGKITISVMATPKALALVSSFMVFQNVNYFPPVIAFTANSSAE